LHVSVLHITIYKYFAYYILCYEMVIELIKLNQL